MDMDNEITNTCEMAEREWDGRGEPDDGVEVRSDIVATKDAEERGIEFHVSMRDYTQRDMEALIVEAAANLLVGKHGDNTLAKQIEERCAALTAEKVDKHLAGVTAEIIDQPILPKYPFMKADEKPMTMREFIGLTGRDYLAERVDNSGKPTTDRSYSKARMQYLVENAIQRTYKTEIEKATNAAIVEMQAAVRAKHKEFLDAEKARVRDALAKVMV